VRAPIGQNWFDVFDPIADDDEPFSVFDNITDVPFGR
jgi:hypothetical protein